jgi:hypothetical protein
LAGRPAAASPLRRLQIRGAVPTVADPYEESFFTQSGEIAARNADRRQFGRPHLSALARQGIVSRLVVYEPALIVIAGKAKSVVMPG